MLEELFGSIATERVLVFLLAREKAYAAEIARFWKMSASSIARALERLEAGGVLVGFYVGRARVYEYNPRYALRTLGARCTGDCPLPFGTSQRTGSLSTVPSPKRKATLSTGISLVPFSPGYRQAFHDLNREWLETYFHVEPYDIEQLENPERIIENGGEIWFALLDGVAVGTGALYKKSNNEFEIAKMGVKPDLRGHGIGAKLLEKLIERFKARKGARLFLATNAKLDAAIKLYRRYGFEDYVPEKPPEYERANVFMERRDSSR